MSVAELAIRPATAEDLPRLQEIRQAAFRPVFASFRSILGEEIYDLAQAKDDEAQPALLESMMAENSDWEVYAGQVGDKVVGFVSVRFDHATKVGEVGLNAVHPSSGSRGWGTAMYRFAVARMKEVGMQVATVATGGDPSHAPARRAYEKAGFSVSFPGVWMYRRL